MTAQAPERRSTLAGGDENWAPSLKHGPKYGEQGVWKGGVIEWFDVAEETDNKGQTKTYPSGDAILYTWVNVQTDERDTERDDDTGLRRIHLDGIDRVKDKPGTEKYLSKKRAARLALKGSGARDLEEGGELWIRWVEQRDTGAPSLATHWEVVYRTPAQATGQPPAGGAAAAKKAPSGKSTRPVRSVPNTPEDPPF